jgi:hypothetical protein
MNQREADSKHSNRLAKILDCIGYSKEMHKSSSSPLRQDQFTYAFPNNRVNQHKIITG